MPEIIAAAPTGLRRMGMNPHANGGLLLKDLQLPDFRGYAVSVPHPGATEAEATRVLGNMLRDVMRSSMQEDCGNKNFRVFGPDETASNRLNALFDVTNRTSTAVIFSNDDHVAPDGQGYGSLERTPVPGLA